jgi:hypothetical protein
LPSPKQRVSDALEAIGSYAKILARLCKQLRGKKRVDEAAGALGGELNRIHCALINVCQFAPRMEINDLPEATVRLRKYQQYRSGSATVDRAVRAEINAAIDLLEQLASLPPRKVAAKKKSTKGNRRKRKKPKPR